MTSSRPEADIFHATDNFHFINEAYLVWDCVITGVCFNSRVDKCECNTFILYGHPQSQPKCGMPSNDLIFEITTIKKSSSTVL